MTIGTFIISILLITFVVALAGAFFRVRFWLRGQPAEVPLLQGIMAIPKRYLVDVHNVMARDRYAATMHVLVTGGLLASLLLLLIFLAVGMPTSGFLRGLLLAALGVMAVGIVMVHKRRRPQPQRLSGGRFTRLPYSLFAYFAGLFFLVARAPLQSDGLLDDMLLVLPIALLIWGLVELFIGMAWGGPMKHAFAGALHLAYHPRPERFQKNTTSTALNLLDLEQPKLGVQKIPDFAWNQLLGFDACVQCGRCEVVCPAFAVGQPLNPKKLIQDLVAGLGAPGAHHIYKGRGHPGQPHTPSRSAGSGDIVPDLISEDTIWACTTCRACVHECPMLIEHVDAIIDIRRFLILEKGQVPGAGGKILENTRITGNPSGRDLRTRSEWATDLNLPLMRDVKKAEVLLWLGDGAFNLRNQQTLRDLIRLLTKASVGFAVLGEEELDCGDLARRLGDEATFQSLAQRNIAVLDRYDFAQILTADPHVLHCLAKEYPALGGKYKVVHHTTFLARLLRENRLSLAKNTSGAAAVSVTYHDPCYLGRYSGEFSSPREILRATGASIVEMRLSGPKSRCCGGGGGAPLTDIKGEKRIPDTRMEDASATGAKIVATACPYCAVMLEGATAPGPEIKDISELLLAATEP